MNHELAKLLTTALVQFIDRERPEGFMCCSNTECDALERAFMAEDFFYVEALFQRKLSKLTEFEQEVSDIVEYCKEHGENVAFDYAKRHAKTLLALAKKELCSLCDEHIKGFSEGYDKANKDKSYHFPIMPTPPSGWGCDGTHCTNPHGDCINCPKPFTSGEAITSPNTASGTSTATLHGNTSFTDGKEHNPSFTD